MRIQYEFRMALNKISLLSIGNHFQQEFADNRIVTNFDNQTILWLTFVDRQQQWIMIIVDICHLWIDVRIGKNVMSQRFYISTPSFERTL